MPGFHEDRAAFGAEGLVLAHVRAAQPAACSVAPVFVFEHAIDHQDLFAAKVAVRIEVGARRPAHQGRVFGFKLRQRHHAQARHQTRVPGRLAGVDHHAFAVVRPHVAQLHKERATGLAGRGV